MVIRPRYLTGFLFLFLIGSSNALISTPSAPKDLKEAILKGLGFQRDEFKISSFDFIDALVGNSVAYEFGIEIDNKVLQFKLLEDENRWEYVDLPIFQTEDSSSRSVDDDNGLVDSQKL